MTAELYTSEPGIPYNAADWWALDSGPRASAKTVIVVPRYLISASMVRSGQCIHCLPYGAPMVQD
jgi:hypothetical protein